MLSLLHIENIAVIECADMSFSKGFNVLTGETGAGKSIIIDSLNAVLGARTSKELIRNGSFSARVVAEFSNVGSEAVKLLEGLGLPCEDGNVVFRVWAPNAVSVSVVGEFNGWQGGVSSMYMIDDSGVWEAVIGGL